MKFFDKSKSGRLVLASMMAFGVATMFNISVGDAAKQVKPVVIGFSPIIYKTAQNSEGWVVLDRRNSNQPDTTYYYVRGVPGDDDYSLVLSYNGTTANFGLPYAFSKEKGISLVKDGDNLYIQYQDPDVKKDLQTPQRLWLGKFFKYDRRQGGQQPRGYFVSAANLEDSDAQAAGVKMGTYSAGSASYATYLHNRRNLPIDNNYPDSVVAEMSTETSSGTTNDDSHSDTH